MWFLSKLYNYFVKKREEEEKLQRDLDLLLWYDKSLTEEQYEHLHNVIHCGAYESLHSTKWERSYLDEAILYNQVTKKYKNAIEAYEVFKRHCL